MFIPSTDEDRREMLERIGLRETKDLFQVIPPHLRLERDLDLPRALTEMELTSHALGMSSKNRGADSAVMFLGGGCYDHFVPAVVDSVASRSEFYTAYTPYQPEASQGTLQAAFEFQTMIADLTSLDVANASLYEAGSAVVEAANLSLASTDRFGNVVVLESVHPEYRATLTTAMAPRNVSIRTIPCVGGKADLDLVRDGIDSETACLIAQSPNFFGIIEEISSLADLAKDRGALMVQVFDPVSCGLMKRPGECGVDVAVGEGQGLGTPMSYGGPFLGLFACRSEFLRRIPGRIVGETVDRRGRKCFVLTLQTREQHIRREKATSNICSNQGLLALRAAVHLALLGPEGLRETAELCWHKSHYTARRLEGVNGLRLRFRDEYFKEFVLELPRNAETYVGPMLDRGFHAGVPLGRWFPAMERCMLVAVTEKRTKEEIDRYVEAWGEVIDEA